MDARDWGKLIGFSLLMALLGFAVGHWAWQPAPELALAAGAFAGAILGGIFADWMLGWEDEEPQRKAPVGKLRSVYVGNLPFDAKEEEIRAIFARVGKVHRVRIGRDPKTKRPRGYAFVDMDAQGAERALSELKDVRLRGRALKINRAVRDPRP